MGSPWQGREPDTFRGVRALKRVHRSAEVTAPGHGGPVRALRERRFRRRDRAMPELCDIHTLACTQLSLT